MRKFLSTLLSIVLFVSAISVAEAGGRRHRDRDNGANLAIGLGLMILGGAIAADGLSDDEPQYRPRRYERRYYREDRRAPRYLRKEWKCEAEPGYWVNKQWYERRYGSCPGRAEKW